MPDENKIYRGCYLLNLFRPPLVYNPYCIFTKTVIPFTAITVLVYALIINS